MSFSARLRRTLDTPNKPLRAPPRRSLGAFIGPAMLVSVGYMDPGNWATDLEGGARFGYELLWVLLASNAMAWLLQTLSVRLGAVSGLDLAAACRVHFSKNVASWLWILAELAIMACDLAEVLGSAVALNLLFGIPLVAGAILTVVDVLLIFELTRRARALERFVGTLLFIIAACLALELFWAKPDLSGIGQGLLPKPRGENLYVALGILGATVMPHNLYLHSALTPALPANASRNERDGCLKQSALSTGVALNAALFLNAAILVLAAAAFASRGLIVTDLGDAQRLLAPLMGAQLASLLFAVALLCSGQTSTITGTLAGQIVMEGFLNWNVSPVLRRLLTRAIALVPALSVLAWAGSSGVMPLLVASQVALSLQLPFAIVPLLRFTNSTNIMGEYANSRRVRWAAGICTALVVIANLVLIGRTAREWHAASPTSSYLFCALALSVFGFLLHVVRTPLRSGKLLEAGLGAAPLAESTALQLSPETERPA